MSDSFGDGWSSDPGPVWCDKIVLGSIEDKTSGTILTVTAQNTFERSGDNVMQKVSLEIPVTDGNKNKLLAVMQRQDIKDKARGRAERVLQKLQEEGQPLVQDLGWHVSPVTGNEANLTKGLKAFGIGDEAIGEILQAAKRVVLDGHTNFTTLPEFRTQIQGQTERAGSGNGPASRPAAAIGEALVTRNDSRAK
jgi:hypothetical protein